MAVLYAPKSLSVYQTARHYQSGFEDFEAMLKLQQRSRTAEPDLNEFQQEELAAFRGAKDKEYLEKYQTRIRTLEGLIQTAAVKEHPLTLEHVSVALNGLRQNAFIYGGRIDGRKLVDEALL